MRKSVSLTLVGVISLGIAAYVFWQPHPDSIRDVPQAPLSGPGIEGTAELEDEHADQFAPPAIIRRTPPAGEPGTRPHPESFSAQSQFPHDVDLDSHKASIWSEIQANPPRFERRGDPALDADTAYKLYMYFGNCTMAPRTGLQVDKRVNNIAQRAERANEGYLDRIERNADQLFDLYELCLLIPPEVDRRVEAVMWMTEAARLGHEIALVQFYEKAMGFLLRPDRYTNAPPLAMKYPDMVYEFKSTARFALARGMELGHPEAYLAMSRAVYDGLIYQEDPVKAFAYALVAEMKAAQTHTILQMVGRHKSEMSQLMSQEQLAEAEEVALGLWKESND